MLQIMAVAPCFAFDHAAFADFGDDHWTIAVAVFRGYLKDEGFAVTLVLLEDSAQLDLIPVVKELAQQFVQFFLKAVDIRAVVEAHPARDLLDELLAVEDLQPPVDVDDLVKNLVDALDQP